MSSSLKSVPTPRSSGAVRSQTSEPVTYRDVLANRDYRNILLAQLVSNIGNWMELFGIQMLVATTTGSLADQGQLSFYQLAPIPLFGLVGGLLADRIDRKLLLLVTQIVLVFVAAGVAVVSMMKFENPRTLIHCLFILGACHGTVMAFNMPAWQVLTPRLVPREQLTKAITLNGIQFNLTRVLGPAMAGLILARFSSTPLFVLNALSFVGVIVAVWRSPAAPPPAVMSGVWAHIKEATRFIAIDRGTRAVFWAQLLISLLAAPLVRLLPMYVINVYGLPSKPGVLPTWTLSHESLTAEVAGGLLLAVQGVGAVIGGLALRYIPGWYPKHHFIPLAVTGLGLCVSMFSMTTSLWQGMLAMLICGFFWIWAFNQSWAAIQMLAPDAMRGRVLSLTTVIAFGATALGSWLAGHAGEWMIAHEYFASARATQVSLSMLALPLLFAGFVMMSIRTPEVDGMHRRGMPTVDLNLFNAITARQHRPAVRDDPTPPTNVA